MPPAAAADAVSLAEEFGHHTPGVSPFGQRVTVPAMRGRDPVRGAQVRADADAGCFLADVEMQEARGLALAARHLRHAFEAAQQYHLLEQVEQDGAIRKVGCALKPVFARRR